MIKLWLSVSLVLVNVNACKVERCLMRHLLSAAPGGLCCAWLEFVPPSRSCRTWSAAAWRDRQGVKEGLTHWVYLPSCKGLTLAETLLSWYLVWYSTHTCRCAAVSDVGSATGKKKLTSEFSHSRTSACATAWWWQKAARKRMGAGRFNYPLPNYPAVGELTILGVLKMWHWWRMVLHHTAHICPLPSASSSKLSQILHSVSPRLQTATLSFTDCIFVSKISIIFHTSHQNLCIGTAYIKYSFFQMSIHHFQVAPT